MGLWLLLGCIGHFSSDAGREPVRAAWWFDPRQVTDTPGSPGEAPRQRVVLLANSPLPCAAEAVENDPDTPDVDEAAAAALYWQQQAYAALHREGALAVALGLATWEEDFSGRYAIEADAASAAEALLVSTTHVAWAAWFRVDEASVVSTDGIFYTYELETVSFDAAVAAPAWAEVEEGDDALAGHFSFEPTALSGSFRAEGCDNAELYRYLMGALVTLAYAR